MELWALMKMVLFGMLLKASQGQIDKQNPKEEKTDLVWENIDDLLKVVTRNLPQPTFPQMEDEDPDAQEILAVDTEQEEPMEETPHPTLLHPTTASPAQEEEDNFSYVFARLNSMDAAVHRLNVNFHNMDVRVAQFSEALAELKRGLAEARESLTSVNEVATRNQKELGRIDGCLRGRRTQTKCFLVFKDFEVYDTAQKHCEARGGQLAMPADATELGVLNLYLHAAFQPHNWPAWVGINDRRSDGLWLFENGHRVTVFNWYRDHMVTQPNGGARENCVSLSSDDGKWWDNDCERRMYYICEYRL